MGPKSWEVLESLRRRGWAYSEDVAADVWPQLKRSSPNGGPTGGQRVAAGLCGKLEKRGLVEVRTGPCKVRTQYGLTEKGRSMVMVRDFGTAVLDHAGVELMRECRGKVRGIAQRAP